MVLQVAAVCVLGTYLMVQEFKRGQYLALFVTPMFAALIWMRSRSLFLRVLYFVNVAWLFLWLLNVPTVGTHTDPLEAYVAASIFAIFVTIFVAAIGRFITSRG